MVTRNTDIQSLHAVHPAKRRIPTSFIKDAVLPSLKFNINLSLEDKNELIDQDFAYFNLLNQNPFEFRLKNHI